MPPRPSRTGHSFNVLLDPATYTALTTLAERADMSRGQIIRDSIRRRYEMTVSHQPKCADGTSCLCPVNHTVRLHSGQANEPAKPNDPNGYADNFRLEPEAPS